MNKHSDEDKEDQPRSADLGVEELILKNRYRILFLLTGLTLIGAGIFFTRGNKTDSKIEVVEIPSQEQSNTSDMVLEIAGAVEKPGVYRVPQGARVEDLLILAGGISAAADREWLEKYINRAAKVIDGQKIYIPKVNEQTLGASAKDDGTNKVHQGVQVSQAEGLINVNTASQIELESLPGIGPVYAQNIIEQRPYSSIEELVSQGVLKQHVYEKIKDLITVY